MRLGHHHFANSETRFASKAHLICYKRRMRHDDYRPRPAQLKWLLNSDPAIRWQVMRDLSDETPDTVAAERSRVATEGWGAQLLARQSRAGNFGGTNEDRGLLVTLYSLVVLMDLGLDPASKQACQMIERVDKHLVFKPLNNRPFLHGETEPCINGRILALGAYFKRPNDALANHLLSEQLEDGGWNCEAVEPSAKRPPSRRSSFHTTICVLEGLLAYEHAGRRRTVVTKARKKAENYLLERRMFAHSEPAKSLTNVGFASRSPPFGTTTYCVASIICGVQASNLTNAFVKPSKS
jgi:hypothetical protein